MPNGLREIPIHEGLGFIFPGGEVHVDMSETTGDGCLVTRLQSSDAIMALLMQSEIMDRIRNTGFKKLVIPYFPYARQDRITDTFTAFSLKVMAKLINGLGFDEVVSCDVHSDVTPALVDRMRVVPQLELIARHNGPLDQFIIDNVGAIVAPDAGAYKKSSAIASAYQLPLVTGTKVRDTATGAISHTAVSGDVKGKRVLIMDDICDGGRTFTELARALRQAGAIDVTLYVTHGIFSKGYGVFIGLIDRIYTTDSFIPQCYPLTGEVPLFINKLPYKEI